MEYSYKLRMLGVPIEGPTIVYGDNLAVITNASVPGSMIKKKHHACAYHFIREACTAGIMLTQILKVKRTRPMRLPKHYLHICFMIS